MAKFDEVFAELQSKIGAVVAVIAQDPVLAQQVRDAIDGAQAEAVVVEEAAQDEARANALANVIVGVRGVLAEAAEAAPAEEPVEPPVE